MEAGDGHRKVAALDVNWRGQPIRSEGPLVVEYAKRTVIVSPATLVVAGSRVHIAGQLPIEAAAGQGALAVNGTFDLQALSALAPQFPPARGRLELDAALLGSIERLEPEGTLVLRDANLTLPGNAPPLANVDATVALREGVLRLEDLRGSGPEERWRGRPPSRSACSPPAFRSTSRGRRTRRSLRSIC